MGCKLRARAELSVREEELMLARFSEWVLNAPLKGHHRLGALLPSLQSK